MTATYVPTPAALVNVTEPVDTEPRTVASVTQMTRPIADGVMHVQSRTDVVASVAALAGIAAPADGTVRHVLGFGLYVFKTSATTGLNPFRVAASDATPGGWVASAAHQTTLTRQVPVGFRTRGITGSGGTPGTVTPTTTAQEFCVLDKTDAAIFYGALYTLRAFTGATQHYGYLVDLQSEMVDGATLSYAQLRFRPNGHAGLPARQPMFAIVRSTVTAVTLANMLSTSNGFVTLAAANIAAYEAEQALVFTPNQNNVIDKTLYHYYAIIFDEAGTNALAPGLGVGGAPFNSIELAFITIPDARRS